MRCASLTSFAFVLVLFVFSGCSKSDSDADKIANSLQDELTSSLNFEDAEIVEGTPPEGDANDNSAPQIDSLEAPPELIAGQPFSITVEAKEGTGGDGEPDVAYTIIYVEGATKYLKVATSLIVENKVLFSELFGRLSDNSKLLGLAFNLRVAFMSNGGATGGYVPWPLGVDEQEPIDPEDAQTKVSFLNGQLVMEPKPDGNPDPQYPQITKIEGPSELSEGESFTLKLYTDFKTPETITAAILAVPLVDGYVIISGQVTTTEYGYAMEVAGDISGDASEIDWLMTFMVALQTENGGTGGYRDWMVSIIPGGTGPLLCDDDNPCTTDEEIDGKCVYTPIDCNDDISCTDDSCNPEDGQCVNDLQDSFCLIGDACVSSETVDPENPCQWCDPATDTTAYVPHSGIVCDDGMLCTEGDTCDAMGSCNGTPIDCNDDISCTDDSCNPEDGQCINDLQESFCLIGVDCILSEAVDPENPCQWCDPATDTTAYVPHSGIVCDDGMLCTEGDTCDAMGSCNGTPIDCNDDISCTDDSCNPEDGQCINDLQESFCLIGVDCILSEAVDPENPCQWCDPATDTTAYVPHSGIVCDDGMLCTEGDTCDAMGSCNGTPIDCNDDISCTDDSCNPEDGQCINDLQESFCLIGVDCILSEAVDPENPCQWCDPATDTTAYVPHSGIVCDDGMLCTEGDTCDAMGSCNGTPIDCNDDISCTDDSCNPEDGQCINDLQESFCLIGVDCILSEAVDPENPCQWCDPATDTTAYVPHSGIVCDDGMLCTEGDTCDAMGSCNGTPIDCNDDISCTDDSCNPEDGQCINDLQESFCLIGVDCILSEAVDPENPCQWCDPATDTTAYVPHSGIVCDDGMLCTEGDTCDAMGSCNGTPIDCNDDISCTDDSCNPEDGQCINDLQESFCLIGVDCILSEAVDPENPCQWCDPATDTTAYVPHSGIVCDDGMLCTEGDTCDAMGSCNGTPIDCNDDISCTDDSCNPEDGQCINDLQDSFCLIGGTSCYSNNDPNPMNACEACNWTMDASGWSIRDGTSCDDGDPQTSNDTCVAGICEGLCGNGNPNDGEECDDGALNTETPCDVTGIESCVYCDTSCAIQTVYNTGAIEGVVTDITQWDLVPLDGVTVEILSGPTLGTTTTATDGSFSLSELLPGSYLLKFNRMPVVHAEFIEGWTPNYYQLTVDYEVTHTVLVRLQQACIGSSPITDNTGGDTVGNFSDCAWTSYSGSLTLATGGGYIPAFEDESGSNPSAYHMVLSAPMSGDTSFRLGTPVDFPANLGGGESHLSFGLVAYIGAVDTATGDPLVFTSKTLSNPTSPQVVMNSNVMDLSSPSVYWFDESTGHWEWVSNDLQNLGSAWQFDVHATGWWAIADVYDPSDITCFSGTIVDNGGSPVENAEIVVSETDSFYYARSLTDASGDFCVDVLMTGGGAINKGQAEPGAFVNLSVSQRPSPLTRIYGNTSEMSIGAGSCASPASCMQLGNITANPANAQGMWPKLYDINGNNGANQGVGPTVALFDNGSSGLVFRGMYETTISNDAALGFEVGRFCAEVPKEDGKQFTFLRFNESSLCYWYTDVYEAINRDATLDVEAPQWCEDKTDDPAYQYYNSSVDVQYWCSFS